MDRPPRRRWRPTTSRAATLRSSSHVRGALCRVKLLDLGQFQTAEDHLRTLRDISDVLNDRSLSGEARTRLP